MIRPLPKPLLRILPHPKLERLPKGKAVSIGIGFRCDYGVVLCSDTQITWKGKHKTHESKLFYLSGTNWTMASVYAGDPQLWKSFRDKFTELIQAHWKTNSREPATAKELRDILETALCYFNELDSDPMSLCLLVGFIIPNKAIKLVKTEGKLISDVSSFDFVGCGDSSVLRYLAPIMADRDRWMSINQALQVGTHWVLQAKRYAEDCGGDTDAFVLDWDGRMGRRSEMTYNWEQHMLRLEKEAGRIFQSFWDKSIDTIQFDEILERFCTHLREERTIVL